MFLSIKEKSQQASSQLHASNKNMINVIINYAISGFRNFMNGVRLSYQNINFISVQENRKLCFIYFRKQKDLTNEKSRMYIQNY